MHCPTNESDSGQQKTDGGHQERRNGLEAETDREICRSLNEIDGGEAGEDAETGRSGHGWCGERTVYVAADTRVEGPRSSYVEWQLH